MSMVSGHATNRDLLRFSEEVKRRFVFLETKGFHCVRAEATIVRYEGHRACINIYHGRRSYEIGLEIQSPGQEDSYSISEILRLVDTGRGKSYRYFATHTVDGVADGVRQVADTFLECVRSGILEDTQHLFSRLAQQQKEIVHNYAMEIEMNQARQKSASAWAKKDYARVVEALAPIRDKLSSVDLKRLEYSEKRTP